MFEKEMFDEDKFITVDSIDAEVELKFVCDALTKQGIKHWLSSGTFLGIYRDGKFLEDDTDIDIGIISDKIPILEGYKLETVKIYGDIMQTIFRSPRNIAIDLMWFYERGKDLINKNEGGTWVKPKDKMELESIKFRGTEYPCPKPTWYLENRFLTWETRIPKGKKWTDCAGRFLQ